MTRPRRALSEESGSGKNTVGPIVLVAAAVLILAGVIGVIVWQFRPLGPNAAAAESPSATAAPTPQRDPVRTGARLQLQSCADQVAAGDRVLDAADAGIRNWSDHVRAQTDADNGKISAVERDAIFVRTGNAGPSDIEAFDKAVNMRTQMSAACRQMPEAPQQLEQLINQCVARLGVQESVLRNATASMNDWRSHLTDAHGERAAESQEDWIRDWSAAPSNLERWQKASADYELANSCTA